jgi:hypothetical protein
MKRNVLFVLAAVAVLAIGSAAIASNMGFKISIPLTAGTATNWVSIPYYNSYTNAASVFNDITGASQVSRWDNPTSSFQNWSGTRGTNFNVAAGEAYAVKVSTATNWIVVGSHNPSLALSLSAGTATNWVSVPYHTTATNAATLFNQITSASQVSRWDNPTSSFQNWSGTRGTNFNLTAGEGIAVKVSAISSWTPAHY